MAPKEEAAPKVIDLMEALRRSLDQVSAGRKPTAKVEEPKAAPAAKKAAAKAPKLVAAKAGGEEAEGLVTAEPHAQDRLVVGAAGAGGPR